MPIFKNKSKAPRSFWRRKRNWLLLILLGFFGFLVSCSSTRVLMQTAPSKPKGAEARPAIMAANLADWETQKPTIAAQFEEAIYGKVPTDLSLDLLSESAVPEAQFGGAANLEFKQFSILKNGAQTGRAFGLVIVTPANASGPVPVVMMQSFCPNHDVIPHPDVPKPREVTFSCSGDGALASVFGYFFGRYITTPPITEIMQRGYALAVMYPSEFVPDNIERGGAVLNSVFADQPKNTRTGALAAWAAEFSLVTGLLETDPRFNAQISYGHSRYGKSALLAAAFDDRIDGVISHQSGTGGASLTKDKPGETLTDITEAYPIWFNKNFASFSGREDALPVDQHHLLALIAPRPVLLGNAKRDVWSDPNGAFRASMAASDVYGLYGSGGLQQAKLTDFDPGADLSFWLRPGTHGVVKEDWPAFLEFLDAHFKP